MSVAYVQGPVSRFMRLEDADLDAIVQALARVSTQNNDPDLVQRITQILATITTANTVIGIPAHPVDFDRANAIVFVASLPVPTEAPEPATVVAE